MGKKLVAKYKTMIEAMDNCESILSCKNLPNIKEDDIKNISFMEEQSEIEKFESEERPENLKYCFCKWCNGFDHTIEKNTDKVANRYRVVCECGVSGPWVSGCVDEAWMKWGLFNTDAESKKETPYNYPNEISLSQIADLVHALAWKKGWHSKDENEDAFIERACNNLHDEISELHEAWRNNKLHKPCDKAKAMEEKGLGFLTCAEEEFADIIIRVLDNCKKLNINIYKAIITKHDYNRIRPARHGGKKS